MLKSNYTITQNSKTLTKCTRILRCKTELCPASAKIKDYTDKKKKAKLCFSILNHIENCKYNDILQHQDPFKHPEMLKLLESTHPPTKILKLFTSRTKINITINDKNRKKIANLKQYVHSKSKAEREINNNNCSIFNLEQLKAYARDNCLSSLEIQNINTNTVFVPGYIEEGEHISVVLTTKNLLSNYLKQSKIHGKFWCVDGTYRLNKIEYPSIVLGTIDNNRKLHFSKFPFYNFFV